MNLFLDMVKEKNLSSLADTVHATGGGAYKFENDFKQVGLINQICDAIKPNESELEKN